jgi:hypothetical protein
MRRFPPSRVTSLISLAALALVCLVIAALLIAAAPARADMSDVFAAPTWSHFLQGILNSEDVAADVAIGADGAVYVCGYAGSATDRDLTLAKYVHGASAWGGFRSYAAPGHAADQASAIALGPKGVIYTVGTTQKPLEDWDFLVVKWSASTGKVLRARVYDSPFHKNENAYAVAVDRRGNVVVGGWSEGKDGNHDWLVRSWTAAGAVRWTWRSDWTKHASDAPADLVVAADGSVFLTGSTNSVGPHKMRTVRLSAAGKLLWSNSYAGPDGGNTLGQALVSRPGGGVYVCGYTDTVARARDGVVISYTPGGTRTVFELDPGSGGAGWQQLDDIAVTSTGTIVAVGEDSGGLLYQPHYVLYAPSGVLTTHADISSVASDRFTSVATDAGGGYYMAGTVTVVPGHEEILTVRRSTLGGAGSWTNVFDAGVSGSCDAIAVRGSTAAVVGMRDGGPVTGLDQFVEAFVY